ncbi:MAG: hypothetical protein ACR2NL_11885, partial [Acidimicrobiia bacterium]
MRRLVAVVSALALLVAACGNAEQAPTPFAVVASANGSIGVGQQRVLFALLDLETDQYLASEDRPATMVLRDQNGAPIETYDMHFIWTVPEVRGLYGASVFVPEAGVYQVTIDAEGLQTAGPVGFQAFDDSPLIQIGEAAPLSATRTQATHPDLSTISSDRDPDPALYQLSVDEAVSNGSPAVVIFATPAFCTSATCGPLLDQVKNLRTDFAGVD